MGETKNQLLSLLNDDKISDKDRETLVSIIENTLPEEERQDFQDIRSGRKLPSLTSDVIAKRIFSPELHPERLEKLLRLVTGDEEIEVKSQAGDELPARSVFGKKIITDIPAVAEDGRRIDLEVQVKAQDFIFRRMDIYSSDLLMIQYSVEEGKPKGQLDYINVEGILLIVLMKNSPVAFNGHDSGKFVAGEDKEKAKRYVHRFGNQVADTGLSYKSLLSVVYVQLDECLSQYRQGLNGEGSDEMQSFLSMIADVNDKKVQENIKDTPFGTEIMSELGEMSSNKEVQAMLLEEKYARADWYSSISASKREGNAEGHVEERVQNIETVTRNLMKKNPGMSYESAKENALSLFA